MEPAPPTDMIVTMVFDPLDGLVDLETHLAALKAQAEACGHAFNRHDVRNELQAATFRLRDARDVRLLVSPTGAVAIEILPPK